MFHRRNLLQCVLLFGILFQSSFYLWTKRGEIHPESGQLPAHPPKKIPHKIALEFDSSFESTTDSKSASPCGDILEWHISNKSRIEPFPKFKVSAKNFAVDRDMLRTYDWWDLWKGDQNCTRYQVHLLKQGSQPQPGAFVSFPGSGNSWIRSLLMGITGIYVTSVYTDEARYFRPEANSSYEIPINCGCSLLQKTHDFSLDGVLYRLPREDRNMTLLKFNGTGILVIRNPFKAIQSYFNFIYGGMTGTAPQSAFKDEKWDNFVSRSVAGWETLNTIWIRGLKRGGIIYYERLLHHDSRSELIRLVTMLGLNYDNDRLECVLHHSKDNSFKRGADADFKQMTDPYTASQRLLIHKAIEDVQLVLKERGLDPLPVRYYDFFDNTPEYGLISK